MSHQVSLDWLAFYLCAIASVYIGYQGILFAWVLPLTLGLLVVQIYTLRAPPRSEKGFFSKKVISNYSLIDCFEQYSVDFILGSIFFFIGLGVKKLVMLF